MEYIVNKTVDLINEKTITNDNEAIIRIDGFEDISFYENVASKITNEFKNSNLKIDIKLAKNKWLDFCNDNSKTSSLAIMKQNGWVAEDESITRYRNRHKWHLLILMGTELEEDQGGLLNCYSITPDTIAKDIDGKYQTLRPPSLKYFSIK